MLPISRLRAPLAAAALLAAFAISAVTAWADAPRDSVMLSVPQRSQADGTVWASTNCGPASIGMVLEGFGQKVSTSVLRDRANQLLGMSDPNTGTRIQDLAQVVREHGLVVTGPYSGGTLRVWNVDQVREELRSGHPVVVEVYFPLLPNHRNNPIPTDHYVVIVGFTGDDFFFNDPADTDAPGYRQRISSQQLVKAWGASDFPFAAFSVGPAPSPQSQGMSDTAGSAGFGPGAQPPSVTPAPTGAAPARTAAPTATPGVPTSTALPTVTPATQSLPVASGTPTPTAPTEVAPQPLPTPTASPTADAERSALSQNARPASRHQDGGAISGVLAILEALLPVHL